MGSFSIGQFIGNAIKTGTAVIEGARSQAAKAVDNAKHGVENFGHAVQHDAQVAVGWAGDTFNTAKKAVVNEAQRERQNLISNLQHDRDLLVGAGKFAYAAGTKIGDIEREAVLAGVGLTVMAGVGVVKGAQFVGTAAINNVKTNINDDVQFAKSVASATKHGVEQAYQAGVKFEGNVEQFIAEKKNWTKYQIDAFKAGYESTQKTDSEALRMKARYERMAR